jgi:rubrerythrin
MSGVPGDRAAELLAQARIMEVEAAERYDELAAQLELHGNGEVASLFRKLAGIERRHADTLADDLQRRGITHTTRAALASPGQEGLETAPGEAVHYLMTPYHALKIALEGEEHALAYFSELAAHDAPEDFRRLAREFAEEERMHVALVRDWLARVPPPTEDWASDQDEPRTID